MRRLELSAAVLHVGTMGTKMYTNPGNLYAFDLPGSSSPDKLNPPPRPDPMLLRPDWKLQPSAAVTSAINNN